MTTTALPQALAWLRRGIAARGPADPACEFCGTPDRLRPIRLEGWIPDIWLCADCDPPLTPGDPT